MIEIFDVLAVPAIFILMGLLTIPIVRRIRAQAKKREALLVGWLLLVFIICFVLFIMISSLY